MNIEKLKKRYNEFVESCGCEGMVPEISEYVQALEDATRWRDVREEFPGKGDAVLTINTFGMCSDEREQLIGFIDEEDEKWYMVWCYPPIELTPTHWQPLPAGPND